MDDIVGYLSRYGIGGLLSEDLVQSARLCRFGPGQLIFRGGDDAERFLFLVEGKAKAYNLMEDGKVLLVGFYRPLGILGDLELFGRDRYVCNVEAISASACVSIPCDAIRRAAGRNAPLLMYLCGSLSAKLADFNALSARNLRYPLKNRFASYLLAAEGEGDSRSRYGTLGEIADLLGASYRQLERVAGEFRKLGLISGNRGRLEVLDVAGLRAMERDLYI